ncbi:MAG: type II toxin-antitoxin system MqsR family toxin [Sphingomonadales bacterium]|nr:type II toxin-antitoxin system MqsR family toxin [Sphingomonadales bacterium]
MPVKRTPHHDLKAIQAKFADADTLEITSKAARDAQKIGYSLEDIVDVVQALEPGDFIKSETAHNPPNHRLWHDTYNIPCDGLWLYLKFAGETLIDVVLTSFKEV